MERWEYARLESTATGINVVFTHQQPWSGLAPEAFFDTLRRLGDEGWELVTALPLAATAHYEADPDQEQPDRHDPRMAREPGRDQPPPQRMNLQVATDRWLLFKRPQPAAPPQQGGDQGADVLKGLVGRQLLKGKLPLP
ncbi:MAG: hypothetical protein ACRDJN_15910 [Chloroflexota bacterium]